MLIAISVCMQTGMSGKRLQSLNKSSLSIEIHTVQTQKYNLCLALTKLKESNLVLRIITCCF